MKNFLVLIAFYILLVGCARNTVDVADTFDKIGGTYKIDAVLTDGKTITQTNATLIVNQISNSSNTANFTVTYLSDNGKTIINQLQTKIEKTSEGYVLFYDPIHYPNSRFAIWNNSVINCNPLTGQGPSIGFNAKK